MPAEKSNYALTCLTISTGFLVLYFILNENSMLITALLVGLAGTTSRYLRKIIHGFWMKLSFFLGLIVPKFVLTIIYTIILFPVALLSRLLRQKDPLKLKNSMNSTFTDVDKKFDQKYFEKLW